MKVGEGTSWWSCTVMLCGVGSWTGVGRARLAPVCVDSWSCINIMWSPSFMANTRGALPERNSLIWKINKYGVFSGQKVNINTWLLFVLCVSISVCVCEGGGVTDIHLFRNGYLAFGNIISARITDKCSTPVQVIYDWQSLDEVSCATVLSDKRPV